MENVKSKLYYIDYILFLYYIASYFSFIESVKSNLYYIYIICHIAEILITTVTV